MKCRYALRDKLWHTIGVEMIARNRGPLTWGVPSENLVMVAMQVPLRLEFFLWLPALLLCAHNGPFAHTMQIVNT